MILAPFFCRDEHPLVRVHIGEECERERRARFSWGPVRDGGNAHVYNFRRASEVVVVCGGRVGQLRRVVEEYQGVGRVNGERDA